MISLRKTLVNPFSVVLIIAHLYPVQKSMSQEFAKDSIKFAIKIDSLKSTNDTLNLCRTYYKLGRLCDEWEKREPAYLYLNKALNLSSEINYSKATVTISNRLACLYSEEGLHDKALGIYDECVELLKGSGDTNRIPTILMNIGSEYEIMGNFEKAIKYKLQAIKMKEEMQDSSNIAFHYLFVGDVYKLSGNNKKWKHYLDIAYSLRNNEEYADKEAYCIIYENLALYSKDQNDIKNALAYYDTLYVNSIKSHYIKGIYRSLSGRAEILSKNNENYTALILAEESLQYIPEEQEVLIGHNNLLAELYLRNKDVQKANYYLRKNISKNELYKFPNSRLETYKLLYQVNKKMLKHRHALEWNEAYNNLSDSLSNLEMLKNTEELETKYRTEKKEQEIKQLSAENELKNQRIRFAIAVIIAILLAAGFTIFWLIIRRRKAKIEQEHLKQQLFRSQMNPHFIFNALGSIQNYLYKNQPKIAANYLGNFVSLTRSILINSAKESISLEEEIETLKNYIELEKMRMKEAFNYEISFDEDMETEFINIPPMLIQPFVENAIKHGLKDKKEGGQLRISFTDKKNLLEVQVTDNGIGIDNSKNKGRKGHKSMALSIFNQRIKIIRKQSKQIPLTKIEDLSSNGKQGTLVELSLPILN